ncbi:PKD domain-containing protein [Haloarcula sp. K1]|uniref:PKD domain-containing protein n=1 Tax=Haloarcula sp. K1 TaxID=1622207 RepID=UPI00350F5109
MSASSSSASNGSISEYRWEYEVSDNSTETAYGKQISQTWNSAGEYQITLTVTDNNGNTDTARRTIGVAPKQIDSSEGNPLVENESGAYRLLTNNDHELNGTGDYGTMYSIPVARLEQRMVAEGSPLIRIDNQALTLSQAAQFGLLTDSYRENLYLPVRLPTNDTWQSIQDVEVVDTYFLGFSANETHGQWTGDSRLIWVKTKSGVGWKPVRNAHVYRSHSDGEYSTGEFYIDNKDEAEVYNGDTINYTEFNRQVVEETFIKTGPDKSQVVVSEGEPRYSLGNASVSGRWSGKHEVIVDQYASTARIDGGAIYDDFWLVNPDGINVTVLNDYRLQTPSRYESESDCTYTVGNETKHGTDTKWEEWTRTNYDNTVRIYHAGTYYEPKTGEYIFNIQDPQDSKLVPYSRTEVTFTHEYGVDSTCPGNDWSESETVTVSNTYNATSHNIKPATAEDLNITVYLVNQGQERAVYFDTIGDKRPEANPLDNIELVADGDRVSRKNLILRTPWIFVSQSLYDRVEMRQEGFDEWRYTSTEPEASLHNLHRDYLDANKYKIGNQGNIKVTVNERRRSQVYEGVNVSPYVNSTAGNVQLYQTVGAKITEVPGDRELNNPRAYATDVFGNRWEVDVVRRNYTETDIELEPSGSRIDGQLIDSEGNGVPEKELSLSGAQNSTVTTNKNGNFSIYVADDAPITSVEFKGDSYRADHDIYYDSSKTRIATATNMINIIGTPMGYLSDMISNLMVFVEWMALGLFIVYWLRFRDQEPRK